MTMFSDEVLAGAMRAALAEARAAAEQGEFPYGAVIVAGDGRIVARAQDRVARDRDPTAHAEIAAVRAAVAAVGPDLSGHALVSTAEACAMCSAAAWWAGIGTHAYGLSQVALKALRPEALEEPMLQTATLFAAMKRPMRVAGGVLEAECRALWA